MKLEKKNWKIHKQVEIKQHTLNNQEVKEETEKEIRKYHKTNKNENTTYQNLWDAPKPVPRGGFTLPISARDARDPGSVPGSGRSPGEENGNPVHYSCLENSVNRGAWQATVHGVA